MDGLPPPRIDLLAYSPHYSALIPVLDQLLEPSGPLHTLLAPRLHSTFKSSPPRSYKELLLRAQQIVDEWNVEEQAMFLASHPRIGETQGLSAMSGNEQGPKPGQQQTPGEVLKRLSMLNTLYEIAYPGLRFVTFVNGRPRAAIVPEMQTALDLALPEPSPSEPEPRLHTLRDKIKIHPTGSQSWRRELKRGLEAMWQIAFNRLEKLNLQ